MEQIGEYWKAGPTPCKIAFWILLTCSTALIIASFLLPPLGIIDSSVLTAFGEIQGFASIGCALESIHEGMIVRLQSGNRSIEIIKEDKNSKNK